jgi:Lamin Tail Domain
MRFRALLVACLVAASSLLLATPAHAEPATVYIYKVYYNSPGSDTGSNTSLNAEYVVIRNGDDVSHSISGWTVRDAAGHTYTFGTLRLGAGKQAIIHTGKGTTYNTSASTHLYWGRGWYVRNNTGDKVILRRADGSLKDTCTYPGEGASKYYC